MRKLSEKTLKLKAMAVSSPITGCPTCCSPLPLVHVAKAAWTRVVDSFVSIRTQLT